MNRLLQSFTLMILAPLALLNPGAGHCQTAAPTAATAATAPEERLPHISITTMGAKGSPVILIPGLASPRATWDGVAPALAADHRVYLVQVNGFAGDDAGANLAPGVLAGAVADLDGYIARNKLSGAAVIGHSMGGLIGMMLAKAHPADVSRLMIVDSLPWFGAVMTPPGVEANVAMLEPRARAMRDSITAGYGKPVNPAIVEAQVRGLAIKPHTVARLEQWVAVADPRVTAQAMYEDLTTDLRGDMAGIATPITLVYPWDANGPGEAMVTAFYHAQYKDAPHVSYVPVADAGHFVMLDQPQAFQAAVTAFMSGN